MSKNVMIVGAGAVSHVATHMCAQYNDFLGDICVASRTEKKCQDIIESVHRKDNLKDKSKRLYARTIDAMDTQALSELIRETDTSIVLNLGSSFVNMSVLEACLNTGASYIDTAIHEDPNKICEEPPWYANYEWKRKDRCTEKGISAILGVGFDPGVVNAYCAMAVKMFDEIDTIDIMDVNAGNHGKYFATNFDPEINFREFTGKVWSWVNREWVSVPMHSVKKTYDFPVVGEQTIYLTGHDELHSLSKNIDANSIRFWMGFGEHYISVFNVLRNIGLLSEKTVKTAEGLEVVPLKVVKACLPDPMSLAPAYTGKTCIGSLVKGIKDGKPKEVLIYNVCDHERCYKEVESQAISYTAGVPAAAAVLLLATKTWDPKTLVNVEELDYRPFIELLKSMGLGTKIQERC